jgi:predicted SAM-dependent methyltransferase
VDMIYACHVLEHFVRTVFMNVLQEWRRVLKSGGLLRVSVPDFRFCAEIYYEKGLEDGLSGLISLISGGQRDEHDFHKMIFDEPFLTSAFEELGFTSVRRWDWRETDHAEFDDFSQADIPHMDKNQGTLMSLNLEAIKA